MTWTQAFIAFAVALIPTLLSAYFAIKARNSENEMSRLREMEARVAERKYEMFEPMLQVFGDLLTPGRSENAAKKMEDVLPRFMTFVGMFGSDEVVQSFYRFRTAGTDAPTEVTMRLVADFLVAARKDIAVPQSTLTGLEVLGMRINDLFEQDNWTGLFNDDLFVVCGRYGWEPPWTR